MCSAWPATFDISIFNRSLSFVYVPDAFKIAHISSPLAGWSWLDRCAVISPNSLSFCSFQTPGLERLLAQRLISTPVAYFDDSNPPMELTTIYSLYWDCCVEGAFRHPAHHWWRWSVCTYVAAQGRIITIGGPGLKLLLGPHLALGLTIVAPKHTRSCHQSQSIVIMMFGSLSQAKCWSCWTKLKCRPTLSTYGLTKVILTSK